MHRRIARRPRRRRSRRSDVRTRRGGVRRPDAPGRWCAGCTNRGSPGPARRGRSRTRGESGRPGAGGTPRRTRVSPSASRSSTGASVASSTSGVLGEVVDAVGDLRPRRGHELAEHSGGDVPLCRLELLHGGIEVRADDRLGTSQPLQCVEPELRRTLGSLRLPQAHHHELQVGGLDLVPHRPTRDAALTRGSDDDLSGPHLCQYCVDQRRLDRQGVVRRVLGVVPIDRSDDRLARFSTGEVGQPVLVRIEVGDVGAEPIELAEGVLAERDEEVRRRHGHGEAGGELTTEPLAGILVVQEVVLELVEDAVDGAAHRVRPGPEPIVERRRRVDRREHRAEVPGAGRRCCIEGRRRIVAPGAHGHDERRIAVRLGAQVRHHTSEHDRALADAARAVQDRQAEGLRRWPNSRSMSRSRPKK